MTDPERLFGDEHVRVYRETDGEVGHIWRRGSKILLLTTRGRTTGEPRTSPLIYENAGMRTSSSPRRGQPAGTGTCSPSRRSRCRCSATASRDRQDGHGRGARAALAAVQCPRTTSTRRGQTARFPWSSSSGAEPPRSGDHDEPAEQLVELVGRWAAEPGVHHRRLDDRARRRDEPVEAAVVSSPAIGPAVGRPQRPARSRRDGRGPTPRPGRARGRAPAPRRVRCAPRGTGAGGRTRRRRR